jgi:hypothetical protein
VASDATVVRLTMWNGVVVASGAAVDGGLEKIRSRACLRWFSNHQQDQRIDRQSGRYGQHCN